MKQKSKINFFVDRSATTSFSVRISQRHPWEDSQSKNIYRRRYVMIAIQELKKATQNTLFCEVQTVFSPFARKNEKMHAIRRIRRALYDITYKITEKAGASIAHSYGIILPVSSLNGYFTTATTNNRHHTIKTTLMMMPSPFS